MKQMKVTSTDIAISWSAPTKGSGQEEMCVDQYYVQYQIGPVRSLEEVKKPYFELTGLQPQTYVVFTIRAEYKGRLGPEALIALSTGTLNIHMYSVGVI